MRLNLSSVNNSAGLQMKIYSVLCGSKFFWCWRTSINSLKSNILALHGRWGHNGMDSWGAIHSTKIPTGPNGKSGPPQKVNPFFRNFSGWTKPIHWVLDRNFRKFWLNGSRPWIQLLIYSIVSLGFVTLQSFYITGSPRKQFELLFQQRIESYILKRSVKI